MILMVDAIRYNARQKDAVKNVEKLLGEFGEKTFFQQRMKNIVYISSLICLSFYTDKEL